MGVGRIVCRIGKERRHGLAIRELAREICTTSLLRDGRRWGPVWSRVRRMCVIRSCRVLSITHGAMVLLPRCICRLHTMTVTKTKTVTVTRGASAQSALLNRVFVVLITIRRTGVERDSGSKISFETITTAFAKGPRDNNENDDESNNTDEGKDATLRRRVLQERGARSSRCRRIGERASDIDDACTVRGRIDGVRD